jgi:hypothetical protein
MRAVQQAEGLPCGSHRNAHHAEQAAIQPRGGSAPAMSLIPYGLLATRSA